LQTSGIASSAEENFTISTFQKLSNTLETGGFNERNEPVVDIALQLFHQHPRASQQMKTTRTIMRTTTKTIKGRDDPVLVEASTHGERVNTSSLAYVRRIGKQIPPFRRKSTSK